MTAVTRRGLLGSVAVSGALAAAGAADASPSAAADHYAPTGCIDVHAHALPGFYRRALHHHRVTKASGLRVPSWSPRAAVRFMDDHGIAAQVLSLPDPGVAFVRDADERVALARRANDYLHRLATASQPSLQGRFHGFATLPLAGPGDVDAAIAEARRVLDLGHAGVTLLSNYGTTYLGDPRFTALLTYLSARDAVVFVQGSNIGTRPPTRFSSAVLEGPFDTTRAIVQLSYLGGFSTHTGIRWVFADGGGALPYLSYRTSLLEVYPALAQNLGLDNLDDARLDFARLRFDTAWVDNPAAIASLRQVTSTGHLLLGTDWPFSRDVVPRRGFAQPRLHDSFSRDELAAVTRRNAQRLLG